MTRNQMGDLSDVQLLEAIRAGNTSGLSALLDRHWTPLVTYAAQILGNWDAANDVVQETYVRIWERKDSWSSSGSVSALLYRITRNLALDELRSRRLHAEKLKDTTQHPSADPPTPSEVLEATELEDAFRYALEQLPDRRRETFLLARVQGLSYGQIADVMDVAPQTVANQISAALAELRHRLEPFLADTIHGGSTPSSSARRQRDR